jgi:hypothetical protein
MRCLHCKNFNLRDYPSHAKVGIGRCMAVDVFKQGAVFVPIQSEFECDKYQQAADNVVAKRKEWNESRKGR